MEVKQISAPAPRSPQKMMVVAGVTASGKTAHAKSLARKLISESKQSVFINTDAMQVYTELVVGTNKGSLVQDPQGDWFYADFPEAPIKLVNIISVFSPEAQSFNVSEFQKLARQEIEAVFAAGKVPILVGGSGLYLAAVICDYNFAGGSSVDKDAFTERPSVDLDQLQKQLVNLGFDLDSLNKSDRANPRRLQNLVRKLRTGSEVARSQLKFVYNLELHYLRVDFPAHKLVLRKRVAEMLPGLISECQQLLVNYGQLQSIPAKLAAASGYKQVLEWLASLKTSASLINPTTSTKSTTTAALARLSDLVCNSHYQLARRQEKWFKKYLLRP